jgi:hypothetical protein
MDVTYIASAPALCANSTESRSDDDVTIETRTLSVGYDCQLSKHQNWTDTTSCKENGLVSFVLFSLVCQSQNFSYKVNTAETKCSFTQASTFHLFQSNV